MNHLKLISFCLLFTILHSCSKVTPRKIEGKWKVVNYSSQEVHTYTNPPNEILYSTKVLENNTLTSTYHTGNSISYPIAQWDFSFDKDNTCRLVLKYYHSESGSDYFITDSLSGNWSTLGTNSNQKIKKGERIYLIGNYRKVVSENLTSGTTSVTEYSGSESIGLGSYYRSHFDVVEINSKNMKLSFTSEIIGNFMPNNPVVSTETNILIELEKE